MLPPILDPGICARERVVNIEEVAALGQRQQLAMELRVTITDRIYIDNALGR